jgi:phage terminase small subunit
MGRPRISVEQHRLQGATHLAHALRREPPRSLEPGAPDVPPDLSPRERQQWDAAVKILSARGTLTKGHAFILQQFAVVRARWLAESEALSREGTFVDVVRLDKNLREVRINVLNPRLKVVQQSERQLLALTRELGLASARLAVAEKKPTLSLVEQSYPDLFKTENVQ